MLFLGDFFWGNPNKDSIISHFWNSKTLAPWKKSYDKPRRCIKKQRRHFANKGPSSQSYGFSSSHVQMWELDHKEGWAPKNWCFWILVLVKTLETPLRSNQSLLKETNPEYSLEGLMLKLQYSGHLMWRADSLENILMLGKIEGKRRRGCQRMRWLNAITDSMDMRLSNGAGKDWGQTEKGASEDEMVGWHHRFNAHGFGWTPEVGDGQGGLACCGSWGCKE